MTIARFVQTEQCGWNGRRNKELIEGTAAQKAVGLIKRAERSLNRTPNKRHEKKAPHVSELPPKSRHEKETLLWK